MPFDPDAFLAQPAAPAPTSGFDPDVFIGAPAQSSQDVFTAGAPPVRTLSTLVTGDTAPKPDKYMQAAIEERDRILRAGPNAVGLSPQLPEGYTSRAMAGPLLGWGDTISAGAMTPLEMIRQGTINPAEAYRYAKAREDLRSMAAQQKTGTLGDVAEIVGGVGLMPNLGVGTRVGAALGGGREAAGLARVVPAAARMVGTGVESGALGAIQGASQGDTVEERAANALRGGAWSAALGAPFGVFSQVAPRSTATTPTEAELFALGKRDYRARDRVPVGYDSQAVADRLDNLRQATQNRFAYDAPNTVRSLDNFATDAHNRVAAANVANAGAAPPGSLVPGGQYSGAPNPWNAIHTPRDIASIRRNIYNDAASGSAADEAVGVIASKTFDRILTRPTPSMLAPGSSMADASLAASLDSRGRGNFGAGYRSQTITGAVNEALDQAAAAHSGLNIENTLRQKINAAKKRDEFVGFNAAEQAGADRLIRRGRGADALRYTANLLGGGGGLGQMIAIGGGAGGGALTAYMTGNDPVTGAALGLGAGMAGRVLKGVANTRARNAAEQFAETLRQRSPEYRVRAAAAPMAPGLGLGPYAGAARYGATVGDQGAVRDAIASAILKQSGMSSPEDL